MIITVGRALLQVAFWFAVNGASPGTRKAMVVVREADVTSYHLKQAGLRHSC